jgi:hypothetical protein
VATTTPIEMKVANSATQMTPRAAKFRIEAEVP